jgi:hypothetical protein
VLSKSLQGAQTVQLEHFLTAGDMEITDEAATDFEPPRTRGCGWKTQQPGQALRKRMENKRNTLEPHFASPEERLHEA